MPVALVRRVLAALAAGALALLLSACLLSPGRFTSDLDVRRDGSFSFAYVGEVHLLALSKLAEMGGEKKRGDAEAMKQLLGGIDPASPQAAEELAQRLRRQKGWRKVEYKGDGLFEVDFAIAGRLDHDFAFPTIERFPLANPFVQLTMRNDGAVRIDAPGFGPSQAGGFAGGVMGAAPNAAKQPGLRPPPKLDGRFTVRTDGEVLANNTDEGPKPDVGGGRLEWVANARSPAAPTALVRLR